MQSWNAIVFKWKANLRFSVSTNLTTPLLARRCNHCKLPRRTQASSHPPCVGFGPEAAWMAPRLGHEQGCRGAGNCPNESVRGGNILHHVHASASGEIPHSDLHNNTVHALRLGQHTGGHPEETGYRGWRDHTRQDVHTNRSGMPGCLCECSNGSDQW